MYEPVIKGFKKEGAVYYSERTHLGGILYWLWTNPVWERKVREIEQEHGIIVYHCTHEVVEGDKHLSYLYVSEDTGDLLLNCRGLHEQYPDGSVCQLAYVINLTNPEYSAFGAIGIKKEGGGLVRVY